MNRLFVSPDARKDLEGIKAYIAVELENPAAALNVVSRIIRSIKTLKDMPGIGSPLSSKAPFETNYRTVVCGSYLVFYRYEGKTVFIDRVLYGRRDYVRILFPELAKTDDTEH
ncbi:MAG: type II toxin-antitoxin system RelE/ParE family toxin [Spirochaetaceae bacterium]|jgi:plasmid stabilization system protein ParE|nr:type II toxin-antitoxin system RelE/ParE family toxin [Spirochaetaceae bacterium]